ncbi:Rv0361 family membrane protein [Micromonospora sp. bgisy143]|uniref:Rv0361 family membrane protein n=1 Tax=Micromonospora sp. bgisy143 TaxID=3413790 RepID=UPI003EBDC897
MTYEPIMVPASPPRTARRVLLVLAGVLAVCCVVGSCVGLWFYRSLKREVGPARSVAVGYIDDVRAGDYSGAYGRLCERVRTAMTQEDFSRVQAAQLEISSYEITGVYVNNYNGRLTATATVTMVQKSTGAQATQTMGLVKEDDEWRVCQ